MAPMKPQVGRLLAHTLAAALIFLPAAGSPPPPAKADAGTRQVVVLRLDGTVDPASAAYVTAGVRQAEQEGAEAVVVQIDTPGGLDSAMREIVKAFLGARVPVIAYVAPAGARAASAGVFVAYAAHVAAMAPGTNIGAAHPVGLGGEGLSAAEEKAVNDAAAYLRSLARRRGRDEAFAAEAVRESASLTAKEALARGVIDLIAPDLATLLAEVDGRRVETAAGPRLLRTRGAAAATREMTFRQRLLHAVADPNVAYLLLIFGFYGILFELASPGIGFAGIGGAISLILGLYALQAIGVSWAGLALVALAFALLAADVFAPTHGALTAGGLLALLLGSLLLAETPGGRAVSPWLVLPTVAATGALTLFVLRAGLRAQLRPVTTGREGLVGATGTCRTDLDPEGMVAVHGELWKARTASHPLPAGTRVRVVGVEGLTLQVIPAAGEQPGAGERRARGPRAPEEGDT